LDGVNGARTLIGADKISAGDSAWMLMSTALVLMMCVPGLALFYGGLVRGETDSARPRIQGRGLEGGDWIS
jgi:hypothetical protein